MPTRSRSMAMIAISRPHAVLRSSETQYGLIRLQAETLSGRPDARSEDWLLMSAPYRAVNADRVHGVIDRFVHVWRSCGNVCEHAFEPGQVHPADMEMIVGRDLSDRPCR